MFIQSAVSDKRSIMNTAANNNDDLKSDQQGVTLCPDKTRCVNNSTCVQSSTDAQYSCKCLNNFLGSYCEIKVSSFCTLNNELSTTAFCTNGGVCKERVPWNSTQIPTCSCSSPYKGVHCETISSSTSQMNHGSLGVGKAVGVFIGCILLVGLVVIIIYAYKKRKDRKAYTADLAHHSPLELRQNESIDFHDDDDNDDDLSLENGKKVSRDQRNGTNQLNSVDAHQEKDADTIVQDKTDKNIRDSQNHDTVRKQMEEIDIL